VRKGVYSMPKVAGAQYLYREPVERHCAGCGERRLKRDATKCGRCEKSFRTFIQVDSVCFRIMMRRRIYRQLRGGEAKGRVVIHQRAYPYELFRHEFSLFGRGEVGVVKHDTRSGCIKYGKWWQVVMKQGEIDAICGFQHVDPKNGYGAARFLRRGDIAVVCAPLVIQSRITSSGEHHLDVMVSWAIITQHEGKIKFSPHHPYEVTEEYTHLCGKQTVINQIYNTAQKMVDGGVGGAKKHLENYIPCAQQHWKPPFRQMVGREIPEPEPPCRFPTKDHRGESPPPPLPPRQGKQRHHRQLKFYKSSGKGRVSDTEEELESEEETVESSWEASSEDYQTSSSSSSESGEEEQSGDATVGRVQEVGRGHESDQSDFDLDKRSTSIAWQRGYTPPKKQVLTSLFLS
jgi:hypothetical protein